MSKIREDLASLCHEQWSGWMEYLFSKCLPETVHETETGDLVIPRLFVERWKRQMTTPYAWLSEEEKESDRKEARIIVELFLGEVMSGKDAPND